ncbi:ribosomal protein S6 kinase-like 1 isoform X2 [Dendrobates tinctorius]|uniref:ribosomal protein S6 kinase-like 1 isoform X2 n=1 Tax=Dendrobates tinctorius TaxID=92724 RepID=UPI003CC9E630
MLLSDWMTTDLIHLMSREQGAAAAATRRIHPEAEDPSWPSHSGGAMCSDRDLCSQYRIGFMGITEHNPSSKATLKRDYLVDAARQLHVAQERDANEEYEAAFSHYKHGVELLLSGVTVDPSRERRDAVKRKISQYLKRAEEIFNCHLQRPLGNNAGAAEGYSSLRFRPIRLLSAAVENLKSCQVLQVIDKVQLVYDPTSGTKFILKSLMKSGRCGHRAVTIIPQSVPYMVELQKFYVGEDSLYLRLQHVPGGRLWGHLKKFQTQGADTEESTMTRISSSISHRSISDDSVHGVPESQVRLWGAQVILALDTLHQEGILCKDLNPRNLLLRDNGDVLLTYFGQWREVDRGCCPDAAEQLYVAPEVLGVGSVDEACDWWSLGALLYELMCGQPLYKTLMPGFFNQMEIPFPEHLSVDAMSLLKALLDCDPNKRLGAGPGGAQRIKSHPFFKDIVWSKLL